MVDTVREEPYLLDSVFQDGQPLNSISEQDLRDFVVSVKYLNEGGHQFVLDGQYTVGAPRSISAGVRTQITINGALENVSSPPGATFWNTVTNKITPPKLNDFGIVRLAIRGESTVAAVNRFEVELDAGGTAGIIFQETGVFAKGAANEQAFNFIIPLFAGPDLLANGGVFYITPDLDAEFWEFGITAVKVYGARP